MHNRRSIAWSAFRNALPLAAGVFAGAAAINGDARTTFIAGAVGSLAYFFNTRRSLQDIERIQGLQQNCDEWEGLANEALEGIRRQGYAINYSNEVWRSLEERLGKISSEEARQPEL